METSKAERLERAVATLNDLIVLTRDCELHETAQFIAMAKLNLLMDLNGVTEEEFHALCVRLEDGADAGGELSAHGRRPSGRGKRIAVPEGATPAFRRPWGAPDGLARLRESCARGKQ
jgi:hypothetical protein